MHEKNKLSWAHELAWLLGIVIMALIVLSPQLSYHALAVGDDWEFHWNRFYEAAMQLKTGKFNFFQSSIRFDNQDALLTRFMAVRLLIATVLS